MDQITGVVAVEVALRVATYSRAIVESTEEVWNHPFSRWEKYLSVALVTIVLTKSMNMRDLVGTRFAGNNLTGSRRGTFLVLAILPAPWLSLAFETVVLHETRQRPITRNWAEQRILFY